MCAEACLQHHCRMSQCSKKIHWESCCVKCKSTQPCFQRLLALKPELKCSDQKKRMRHPKFDSNCQNNVLMEKCKTSPSDSGSSIVGERGSVRARPGLRPAGDPELADRGCRSSSVHYDTCTSSLATASSYVRSHTREGPHVCPQDELK